MPSFGEWLYTFDRDSTVAAYARAPHGDATRCGCVWCRNFIAVREVALPKDFRRFVQELGIDPTKEGEVYHLGRKGQGAHFYGGWFHFVGSLETTGDFAPVKFSNGLTSYMCRSYAPNLPTLNGVPLVQLEFRAERVPWALAETEPH